MGTVAFGRFVLDTDRCALLRDGEPVVIGQRALAVLQALADTPGRTVSKDDLIARAWPATIVEGGNLTVQIAALRKVLGSSDDGQGWIVTVPRVGYRLLPAATGAAHGAVVGQPTLAVLPFSVVGASGDGYFADGVVEDIITALSRFRSFLVLARNGLLHLQGSRGRGAADRAGARGPLCPRGQRPAGR